MEADGTVVNAVFALTSKVAEISGKLVSPGKPVLSATSSVDVKSPSRVVALAAIMNAAPAEEFVLPNAPYK